MDCLLAQLPDAATPTTIVGAFIGIALSLAALLGWIMRHVFVTTIPSIIASSEAKHAALLSEQKAQRESHERSMGAMNTAMVGLTAALGEEREAIVNAVNAHTTEQATRYRHDMIDALNKAVLGKELYLAQKAAERGDAKPPAGG